MDARPLEGGSEAGPALSAPRLLIVRFSAIGDCVMTAFAATAFRIKHPDATVDWVAETRCLPVIDPDRLVNARIEVPRDRWKKHRGSPGTWAEQLAFYAGLRRRKYDIGIDFQGHLKTALALRIAKPARRIAAYGTDSLARKLNPVVSGFDPKQHVVDWNMTVLRSFGDYDRPKRPIMPSLPDVSAHVPPDRPLVTITTGAGRDFKQLPLPHWEAVGKLLLSDGIEVAFLGGPNDPRPQVEGAVDLIGRLKLEESMAMVVASAVHLSGDTGNGHIAAAYGVPQVSVFGPTDPDHFRPFGEGVTVLKEGNATADVTPERIVAATKEALACRGS